MMFRHGPNTEGRDSVGGSQPGPRQEQAGRRPVPRLPDTLTAPPAKIMTVRLLNSSSPRNKKEGGEFCLSTLF